ncbi:MAG TPA: IPT/TIG domain-containing protein [Cyclobacteriaceae bacterium]
MMNLRTLLVLAFLISVSACSKEEDPVIVSSFEPAAGDYGTEVTIAGSLFSTEPHGNTVSFGGVNAKVITASSSKIVVKVPEGAVTGKVIVTANGKSGTSASDFTVTAGSWKSASNFPLTADGAYDLFFSIGNMGYIHVGKRNVDGVDVDATMWMYDPSANKWSQKKEYDKDLPQGAPAIVFGTSNKGYILESNTLWEYDPGLDSWTQKGKLPGVFSKEVPRDGFYISSTNRVYVVMSNGYWMVYNPDTDIWSMNSGAPYEESLDHTPDCLVQSTSTHGYLIIGTDVWQYTPETNTWSSVSTSSGSGTFNFTFSIDDNLYIGSTLSQNFYLYKPTLDTWVEKANVSIQRINPIYFSLGENGYMGMGMSTSMTALNDFTEFIP